MVCGVPAMRRVWIGILLDARDARNRTNPLAKGQYGDLSLRRKNLRLGLITFGQAVLRRTKR
jgi:hypothetical protein